MKSTWHILHILMIFLTGGLWIIIYIWRLLANAHSNRKLEYAQQQRQLEAMEAFASCLGFLMGIAGGLVTLTILCLILGKISEILLK